MNKEAAKDKRDRIGHEIIQVLMKNYPLTPGCGVENVREVFMTIMSLEVSLLCTAVTDPEKFIIDELPFKLELIREVNKYAETVKLSN
jgi:hypothetical protein